MHFIVFFGDRIYYNRRLTEAIEDEGFIRKKSREKENIEALTRKIYFLCGINKEGDTRGHQ